jgi:ATP phosphoribosyltransferase
MTLRLAIPSKGRLKEQTEAFFEDAGLRIRLTGGSRGYSAELDGVAGVDVRLMSAGEISAAVLSGEVHAGVTGEDQLREMSPDLDAQAHLLAPLGFGRADLVVAAPRSWIDVDTMADVDDVAARHEAKTGKRLRVATKYVRSTRRFFQAVGVSHYRIVESAGATEGAPAAGAAELVVDITTTGATLESNGLKVLRDGLILSSQAQLAASLGAEWSAEALAALRAVSDVIEARRLGKGVRVLRFTPTAKGVDVPGHLTAFVEVVAPDEARCDRAHAHEVAGLIAAQTERPVRVSDTDFVFKAENGRFDAFAAALRHRRAR